MRILTEPENALELQYVEMMKTEGIELVFERDAIEKIAFLAQEVNSKTEDLAAQVLRLFYDEYYGWLDKIAAEIGEFNELLFSRVEQQINTATGRAAWVQTVFFATLTGLIVSMLALLVVMLVLVVFAAR